MNNLQNDAHRLVHANGDFAQILQTSRNNWLDTMDLRQLLLRYNELPLRNDLDSTTVTEGLYILRIEKVKDGHLWIKTPEGRNSVSTILRVANEKILNLRYSYLQMNDGRFLRRRIYRIFGDDPIVDNVPKPVIVHYRIVDN